MFTASADNEFKIVMTSQLESAVAVCLQPYRGVMQLQRDTTVQISRDLHNVLRSGFFCYHVSETCLCKITKNIIPCCAL